MHLKVQGILIANSILYINVQYIGHFYRDNVETFTRIGVTTHNNGGFKVKETPEQIYEKINIEKSYI